MRVLKVLVGCEESQEVTKAFRELGHEAYSCDILPCSGGHPEWHIQGDVLNIRRNNNYGKGWDLIILHPPCTCLSVSGNRWYGKTAPLHMRQRRIEAQEWTEGLWVEACFACKYVALENPVGVLTLNVKPFYIQPWQFGHGETKKTGLWLHNLPKLIPTNIVDGREQRIWKMAPSADRGKERSKTFPGIAKAMAEQWSEYILENN